ncbi:MAG TPA: hypothetical protein VFY87_15140, partial [Geminicoccaceae bacterium]|nr:hypothetical protein [Geminicoccaceae bacterium]
AALERGLGPDALVEDSPLDLDGAAIRNPDGRYRGRIPLAEALAVSSNAAAVRLALGHVPEI